MTTKLKPEMPLGISRREFLHQNAVLVGGAHLAGPALAASEACRPTEHDVVGPFYRFGAPFRARLAGADEPGDRLILTGTVLGSDCRTPFPGALIEVWQANHEGIYDTLAPGNFTEVTSFHMRGMLRTDENGRYEIETIMPGRYPIPPGIPGLEKFAGLTRPAHIHFKVMQSTHVPVTTQLYFKGDPFIADDVWANHKPSLAIDLEQDGKLRRGVFDIVLAKGCQGRRLRRGTHWRRAFDPRDPSQLHRQATFLELHFDPFFVVAVAYAGTGLHHAIAADHTAAGVLYAPLLSGDAPMTISRQASRRS